MYHKSKEILWSSQQPLSLQFEETVFILNDWSNSEGWAEGSAGGCEMDDVAFLVRAAAA